MFLFARAKKERKKHAPTFIRIVLILTLIPEGLRENSFLKNFSTCGFPKYFLKFGEVFELASLRHKYLVFPNL
jgi:hypothetical protein